MTETANNKLVAYDTKAPEIMKGFKDDYRTTQNQLQMIDEDNINPQELGLIISQLQDEINIIKL